MTKFFESHRLHPLVERTYTLENYAAALQDLAAGNFMGTLVIRLLGKPWGNTGTPGQDPAAQRACECLLRWDWDRRLVWRASARPRGIRMPL